MNSAKFYLIQNGVQTYISDAIVSGSQAYHYWTPTPGMSGPATIRLVAFDSAGNSYTAQVSVTLNVPGGDPFFNSIPATPPDMTDWINSFNEAIWERWTYPDGTRIKGNFYSLYDPSRQVGCSPVEYPDIDCYDALKFTQEKLNKLWSEARSRGQDPRFYLAVLRHEGTGSFNSKPPEGDQNCGGYCADVDFDRDLNRVGSAFIPQKVRAYARASSFRQAWPNEDLFPYVGWWTPIDRNNGESGVYATHFTWYEGIRSIYNSLTGNQSDAFTQYVLRQYQAGNPEFTPSTIRTTAIWNTNANGGSQGTPIPGFVYHSDSAGTQPMTPPPNTLWWLTNNTAGTPVKELVRKDILQFPLMASAASPGGIETMGTFENHLFRLQVPVGWTVYSTLSGDQWVFRTVPNDQRGRWAPVVQRIIHSFEPTAGVYK
jgi:hypothetical protein